jgi:hypothetical protein
MKSKDELLALRDSLLIEIDQLNKLIVERRNEMINSTLKDDSIIFEAQNYIKFISKEKEIRLAQVKLINWLML